MTDKPQENDRAGFGTFAGVFTPSILTIFGVIMYLRMGWMVGNVGLLQSLVIITLSCAITLLTALSISATATNMRVQAGGAYYMISRSLGLEAGAAVGLPLFLAQALGISFYIAGFSESLQHILPDVPPAVIGVATLVVLTALAFFSTDLALKMQFVILVIIVASLVSFFAGGTPSDVSEPAELPPLESFWVVFAVFFPAVTGILSGVSMSGDLQNPSRSLPLGTLAAVMVSYVVYMLIPGFMASFASPDVLRADPMIMQKMAAFGTLILLGIWGSTLSSGLGSLLGAPRTLQALANDRVVPWFMGRGHGPDNLPRIATMITFGIAVGCILLGSLNAIAPILSMFFLTTYGMLNLCAGLEELIGNPSWRPTFRVPWWVSILGAMACFAVMFMIDATATVLAGLCVAGVYYVMHRRALRVRWGDMRRGIMLSVARYFIYRLAKSKPEPHTWRPHMLVLSGSPQSHWHLIEFANAITQNQGFLTIAALIPLTPEADEHVGQLQESIGDYLHRRAVDAMVQVSAAEDTHYGIQSLIRSYGLGPLVPNTIIIGDSERTANFVHFAELVKLVHSLKRNLIVIHQHHKMKDPFPSSDRIDVWWGGEKNNAAFALALAHILQRSREWHSKEINLKAVADKEEGREGMGKNLEAFLEESRLRAKVEVYTSESASPYEPIVRASESAGLVFLGMRPPEHDESSDEYSHYCESVMEGTQDLAFAALVIAAEEIDFRQILI